MRIPAIIIYIINIEKYSLGEWFDGSQQTKLTFRNEDPDYAPEFVLRHPGKYEQLLTPFGNRTLDNESKSV